MRHGHTPVTIGWQRGTSHPELPRLSREGPGPAVPKLQDPEGKAERYMQHNNEEYHCCHCTEGMGHLWTRLKMRFTHAGQGYSSQSFGETGWFERGRRPFVKKWNSHLWNLWHHLPDTYLSSLSQQFHTNSHPWSQSLQRLQQLTSDTQCDVIVYIEVKCRESPLSTIVGSETSWTSENNIQETRTNVL